MLHRSGLKIYIVLCLSKHFIFSHGGDASRSAKARVSINNDSPALCVGQACYRVVESKSEESKEERRASQRGASQRRASQRGESTAAWQAGLQLYSYFRRFYNGKVGGWQRC